MIERLTRRKKGGADAESAFDRRLLAPMMLGSVLNPVNSSIISVSLVPIGAAFGAPPARTAWLVSALYLATSIGQPVMGRLIDLYGPRRLFLAGAALTGIAGLIGLFAPNLGTLIVARVVLGFGTCAGYPAAMYLIRGEARRTGQESPAGILATLAVASQTIAVIGPPLGGLLIGLGGWRSTFAVNIPLAVAGLILGVRRLPKERPLAERTGERVRLDLIGMGLFAAMLVSLLLFLMEPRADRWYLPVLMAVAAAGFAVRELRAAEPFIDLRVFGGNAPLLLTYARALLVSVVSYVFLYGYTQWLQDGRGLTASQAGLAQLPLFLTGIAVSTATGRRAAVRGKLLVGAVGQIVGCVLLLPLRPHSAIWLLIVVGLVFGVPQGLMNLALQNSVYHQADLERMGSSAGLLRTFFYLGAIVASSANGAFFGARADTGGLHGLAWFMLAITGLCLALTLVDRSLGRIGSDDSSSAQQPQQRKAS
ncbi:MFS transporter [Streptomyces rugosispiralis]|uniref:MFS transporter n=1 Tax=Streptomyces rugosispiralis TaxID=2967341 RepID=A0ABT1UV72_9ACTN|nr:MFS transporter [Streptomyces rugosispiralis]MCQ8189018.1 MFS transporter [Streptomyces rugosispiralis]